MNYLQLEIVGHSLGVNVYAARASKKDKDKRLPKTFYRNRFCASDGHSDLQTLVSLEEDGYMGRGQKINEGRDTLWFVTELGIEKFKEAFIELVAKKHPLAQ